jgi:hypothetical protein
MWSCWQVTVNSFAGRRKRACQRGTVDKLSMAVYLGITYWLRLVEQGVPQLRDRCDQGDVE